MIVYINHIPSFIVSHDDDDDDDNDDDDDDADDGIFLACENFGIKFDYLFPASSFLFVCLFEVEISSRTLIPVFRSGSLHSGLASWDDCGRVFPDKVRVSSFPDRFPYYACTAV